MWLPQATGWRLFLAGIDGAGGAREFRVTVTPPDGAAAVTRVMRLGEPTWEIRLPSTRESPVRMLDLALVVDTTGSMGDELEYLKVEIDSIVQAIHTKRPTCPSTRSNASIGS